MGDAIRFLLNGEPAKAIGIDPTTTLLDWLRGDAHLTAAKEGCREGDCGACTVILGRVVDGRLDLKPVNACLVLMPMVDGRLVVTAEGLVEDGRPHPVQTALVEHHGSQCGFCTPGIVMSLMALQHAGAGKPTIHEALGGNLCRCTGYRPIVDAAAVCAQPPRDRYAREAEALVAALAAYDRTDTLIVEGHGRRFFVPRTLAALADLAEREAGARFVAGGTDLGLLITKQYRLPETIIAVDRVPELKRIEDGEGALTLGAAVTYEEALPALDRLAPAFGALVRRIGSRQIRSLGTLAGNLGNASPIGDSLPPLLALGASVRLWSRAGHREVAVEDFLVGYRQTALTPGEVIEAIVIPRPDPAARLFCHKVAKRHEQDISTVSMSLSLTLDGDMVADVRLAYGGLAATAKRARSVETALRGRSWCAASLDAAARRLPDDVAPIDDVRGSAAYRRTVAANLLHRCLAETQEPDTALEVMGL